MFLKIIVPANEDEYHARRISCLPDRQACLPPRLAAGQAGREDLRI